MLTPTELYPLTTALWIVLWAEVLIYLAVGFSEIFDDFHYKSPQWVWVNERLNTYIWLRDKKGHKMHASLALVLGFIALNGVLEGGVFRFEIELIFLSLALLNCSIWCMTPPCKRLLKVLLIAPEFHLQYVSFILFADLVRPEVLGLCILFNLWGVVVFFRKTSKIADAPLDYERIRNDMIAAEGPKGEMLMYDKVIGYNKAPRDG